MERRPPRYTCTDTLVPYTTLFRANVSPIEILKTNGHNSKIGAELAWLGGRADSVQAAALCAAWFPAIEPMFFERLQQAIAGDALWPRVVLGWRLAWRLSHLRRIGRLRATASRCRRLRRFVTGRLQGRRDLALQTGRSAERAAGQAGCGRGWSWWAADR